MDATRVQIKLQAYVQLTLFHVVHVVHRCQLCGGVMHLQFDACETMTYKLVRSVILTFGLYVNYEMR
jgi:hypothetical protein